MNYYSVTGFKKSKRNKKERTLFISTTLSISDIMKAMNVCKYVYNTIIDIASFTDKPRSWLRDGDIEVNLTLFDELRIIKAIN